MELHFLKADDPLTKEFTRNDDGSYEKKPYPFASRFNSVTAEVDTPYAFHIALTGAAETGGCLMKGELDKQLVNESRAGRTLTSKPSEWVIFDLDDLDGVKNAEEFIQNVLPTPFHNASYISQLSASTGITGTGLRLHLFFLLRDPVAPEVVKSWLTETNLDTPFLRSQVFLAAGGMALCFPLDRSVADNSKLIFIAPPVCTNFEDPLAGQRILLHNKDIDRVDFSFNSSSDEVIRRKERKLIKELRQAGGLEARKFKTKKEGELEVLLDADPVEVTDWWEAAGFIHMNLNGGDSGAYWVNPKRPKYIHNFKGEPALVLRDVAGSFWEEIREICGVQEALAFRDQITGKHYHGIYDSAQDALEWLTVLQKGDIDDWYGDRFNAVAPDPIPQYDLVFDPQSDAVVDKPGRTVNKFSRTEYMRLEAPDEPPALGPITERILRSVTGDDEEMLDYLINWLAFIFQYRRKTMVAIVLHGCPGTGKGLLQNKLLRPLFGDYTTSVQLDQLERDLFTGFLANNLIIQIDEAQANDAMRNKIFSWITEERLEIRRAYAEAQQVQTFCNFIFASNHLDAVKIERLDRRFVVAPRQEQPIDITPDEVQFQLPKEVTSFARHLLAYNVDVERATRPMETAAKRAMLEDSRTTVEEFVDALMAGDICYFLQAARAGSRVATGGDDIIKRWAKSVNTGIASAVWATDMHTVWRFISGQHEQSAIKFGKMVTKHGLPKREFILEEGVRDRGLMIEWKGDPEELSIYKDLLGTVRAPATEDPIERKVLDLRGSNEESNSR